MAVEYSNDLIDDDDDDFDSYDLRDHRSPARGRWLVFTTLGVAVVGLAALIFGLWAVATRLEQASLERNETLVERGLTLKIADLRHSVMPQTVWDEAVRHLDNRFDPAWAESNIVQYLFQTGGFETVYVLDGRNSPLMATHDGKAAPASEYDSVAAKIAPLMARVRAREAARGPFAPGPASKSMIARPIDESAVIDTPSGASIVSASLVQPDFGTAWSNTPAPVVVVGESVDQEFLTWLGEHYLLENVRVEPVGPAGKGRARALLRDPAAKPVAQITWTRKNPVNALAGAFAPVVTVMLVLLLAGPLLIIRHLRDRNVAIRRSADAVRSANQARARSLAVVSDEISVPMGGVVVALDRLSSQRLPAEAGDLVRDAQKGAQHLQLLLEEVLDLTAVEDPEIAARRAFAEADEA